MYRNHKDKFQSKKSIFKTNQGSRNKENFGTHHVENSVDEEHCYDSIECMDQCSWYTNARGIFYICGIVLKVLNLQVFCLVNL